MNRYLALLLVLLAACCHAAPLPTTLRVVDIRWVTGQPELETWLGSLQGTLNRQEGDTVTFVTRNDADADLADRLTRMYHLRKVVVTPGALFEATKPTLTGQVRYDAAQPWTRNIALTAAAVSPGAVIATDADLGLPTVLDLRNRWTDRKQGYAWAVEQYGNTVDRHRYVLAPESGHQLADFIASRKLLVVDYNPLDAGEATALHAVGARFPAGAQAVGCPDNRCADGPTALWTLMTMVQAHGQALVPARDSANLSCFARFPITQPLRQRRDEANTEDGTNGLLLIYDGGSGHTDGSQWLDAAMYDLPALLKDPALADLPVGIEVPAPVLEYAPALYQFLIARQRETAVEFIAAPNGDGWLLPMAQADPTAYLRRSADSAKAMDLSGTALFDTGDQAAYEQITAGLAQLGLRGAVLWPIAAEALPEHQARQDVVLPNYTALVATARVSTVTELRTALKTLKGPLQVLYIDPSGITPAVLRGLLPEIQRTRVLLTPSQAFRAKEEYAAVMPFLQAKKDRGIRSPRRERATLAVTPPATTLAAPSAADAIPMTVRITGAAQVLTARVIYQGPDGRVGAADLRDAGNGNWQATLPPTRVGGTLTARARVVEQGGFGVTISDPTTLTIPVLDSDRDGAEDVLESYWGSDPRNPDTDGDGLPDGIDAYPTEIDREIVTLFTPIFPPADAPFLTEAGTSTTRDTGRVVPAQSGVTYRIPLKDLPGAPGALCLYTAGPGSLTINGGESITLEARGESIVMNEASLTATQMSGEAITVRITAGDAPLLIDSLRITGNPSGPYILPVRLSPANPPGGTPITATVTAYSPHGVKAVRLRYGAGTQKLSTLVLTPVDGTYNTVFTGQIPRQIDGTSLIYGIEADDNAGNTAASPYEVKPIGLTRKHSVAMLGARDMVGSWLPSPSWGGQGRMLTDGTGTDTHQLLIRPGTYYVWMLAEPRERGIAVTAEWRSAYTRDIDRKVDHTISAGAADGWHQLGTFTASEGMRLYVDVKPVGDKGYCAYHSIIFTQDPQFVPPLTYAGIDWHNGLVVTGLADGQTVSGVISVNVQAIGNLDKVEVTADQVSGMVSSTRTYTFQQQRDGSFSLDTRGMLPGEYKITVSGMRVVTENNRTKADTLITATLRVKVPQR